MRAFLSFFHRRKNLLAYLLLAMAVSYSIYTVQDQGKKAAHSVAVDVADRRATQIEAGSITTRLNCERDRKTLIELRGIIRDGRNSTKKFYIEGLLTKTQYKRSIQESNRALGRLDVPNCDKFVADYVRRATAPVKGSG